MNEENDIPLTPLDAMVAQDSLQILKAAVPYLNGNARQYISIYTKLAELSNTLSLCRRGNPDVSMMSAQPQAHTPLDMLNDIRRYLNPNARAQIDQMILTLNTIQILQMMQTTTEGEEEQPNGLDE